MKILGFAGSNSSVSINKKLVRYVASYFHEHEVEILDLNDYEMPIYSYDRETKNGIPQLAFDFAQKIDNSDLIITSLAENNSAYSTAFKNIFDWVSRINTRKVFGRKQMFLMATSPGSRGGASVLEIAKNRFPHSGANILETFSLPNFYENFDPSKGIVNEILKSELENKILSVKAQMIG
ncbi:MAG TPA: NAD(P)H-dependent oxidoreductase [Prolixibacteraceae bacterium]|jgi:NAD(P)H-dependent FMN reductase